MRSIRVGVFALLALIGATGCTHTIAFDTDATWHYRVGTPRQAGAALVAVIDEATLADTYDFRAFSTGIAQKWVAQDGRMLGQIADVEFPQVVEFYQRSTTYKDPDRGDPRLTVVLSLPEYAFKDYRAKVRIHVEAFAPDRRLLLSKDYAGDGDSQAGRMIGLGAFGQKSAVRQSSLVAFRNAFDAMRADLIAIIATPSPDAASPR
ncbi:MAG TPA: hypothetical protein VGR62_13265 [Candidatus Binatia bacterium]|jgi:hypothetical protein|nr:hypothetical protein [Candidatus Binatia bacterium]